MEGSSWMQSSMKKDLFRFRARLSFELMWSCFNTAYNLAVTSMSLCKQYTEQQLPPKRHILMFCLVLHSFLEKSENDLILHVIISRGTRHDTRLGLQCLQKALSYMICCEDWVAKDMYL